MFLLDKEIFKGIIKITMNILEHYFFYDNDSLVRFHEYFSDYLKEEYMIFHDSVESSFRAELQSDIGLKMHFTSYFVSYHLHDIMVDFLYFSEAELDAFENILPKYIGATNDIKQSNKRAHY